MGHKVIVTGKAIADDAVALLSEYDIEVISTTPYMPTEELIEVIKAHQASGLIVRVGKISKDVIDASPNMRVIAKHGVGVDNIDLGRSSELGIPVMVTAGVNTRSVSELALTMILSLYKQIYSLQSRMRAGHWDKACYRGTELTGKHLALIGRGAIARDLAGLVKPFDMKVTAYVREVRDDPELEGIYQSTDMDAVLSDADIVSLHCPLNETTRQLFGAEQFKRMKNSAIIINTARGGIVDEAALLAALRNGDIAGAGLDCFETEPTTSENPLFALPNVLVSPHISFATHESLQRMGLSVARNIIAVLEGKELPVQNVVNKI
ncbi:MAG: hydroxyacid dehydrogenase [Halieaceae bacterium]|jgi:D-3-phosphoglycerate dehydrogenase|nr:hydroxyacid dehydrogenase [Halieaceae bacterium]